MTPFASLFILFVNGVEALLFRVCIMIWWNDGGEVWTRAYSKTRARLGTCPNTIKTWMVFLVQSKCRHGTSIDGLTTRINFVRGVANGQTPKRHMCHEMNSGVSMISTTCKRLCQGEFNKIVSLQAGGCLGWVGGSKQEPGP